MRQKDRYDSLIVYYAEQYGIHPSWIKAQIHAESAFDSSAQSPVGAKGLTQFMDPTWGEWGEGDVLNPEEAIKAQCRYMNHLYEKFGEVKSDDQYLFALAAYNAGRGNINKALKLARESEGIASRPWPPKPGLWQKWSVASTFLSKVTGKHHIETLHYVGKIQTMQEQYAKEMKEDGLC